MYEQKPGRVELSDSIFLQKSQTVMVICQSLFICLSAISLHLTFISLYFVSLCCTFYFSISSFPSLIFHLTFPSFFLPVLCWPSIFSFPSPLAELGQEPVPASSHNVVVSAAGVMPYLQGRAGVGEPNSTPSASCSSSSSSSSSTYCDRQPAPPGTMVSSQLVGQTYSLGITNSGLGPPPPKPPGGIYTSAGQHNGSDVCPLNSMVSTVENNLSVLLFTLFFVKANEDNLTDEKHYLVFLVYVFEVKLCEPLWLWINLNDFSQWNDHQEWACCI